MSNKIASIRSSISYANGSGGTSRAPTIGQDSIGAPYQAAEADGQIDVPDATGAGTEIQVPFGAVEEATLFQLENKTGQDIKISIGNAPGSVTSASGTLVSGTKDIALANAVGDQLVVLAGASNGGTPGVLSIKRKSDTEVTVQSWLAGTGIQTADVSDVFVVNYRDSYQWQLPPNGKVLIAGAALPEGGGLKEVWVKTTALQSGDGELVARIFGDPT